MIINEDDITIKRIYSTHCQVCGKAHENIQLVYYVRDDNNLVCKRCADESGLHIETRIFFNG